MSATAIKPPSGDQATAPGALSCPSAEPDVAAPTLNASVRLAAWNTWTRSLPVSATAIKPPSGDQAADRGSLNSPSAPPRVPNLPANSPSALNTWTRSLPVSATASMPGDGSAGGAGGANAMARGLRNTFACQPCSPNAWANVPFGWKNLMRLLPASATASMPPTGE